MKKLILFAVVLVVTTAAGFFLGRLTGGDDAPAGAPTASAERKILYWRAPMDPTEIYDKPGKSKMGMDLIPVYEDEVAAEPTPPKQERKILYWRAPMDPTEIYDKPGKSKMGMDLIPVYEDEAALGGGGTIRIDPAVVQTMGVRTTPVRRMDFSRMIRTVGEVQYDEERLYAVNARISGWIEKLYVHFVGDEVQAGTPLLEIYSPELVTTQEEYLLALKNLARARQRNVPEAVADAEKLLEAARERLVYWAIPEKEIAHLEQTGKVRRTLRLDAPATGVVIDRNALEGMYIRAGQDLFRIADLRSVWVHASFYENEVPWIREGQPVTMELSYLPGKTYTGHVSYIYPYLREKARDVHVRLIFANPDLDLKPGMYANVTLQGRTIPNALVVPTEAVIRSGERALVFVARGEGRFEPREVRLGAEGGPGNRYVHILSGLLDGEAVVVSAQFLLDSESRLQEAIQKMLSARQAPPPAEAPATLPPAAPGDTMDHDTMDHDATDHGTMDHGTMDHGTTDHGTTDHGTMDHGTMDHGTMDHGTTDHSQMDHSQMDHARPDSSMDHGTMDHGTMDHGSMDHAPPDSSMDHGSMDHGSMDHALPDSSMDHGSMDHGSMDHAPPDSSMDHGSMDHGSMDHRPGAHTPVPDIL